MRFQCKQCHAVLELEDGQPGELVQCDQCLATVVYPDTPTSSGAILGEFVIIRELGRGGMGTVYLAHQLTLDRDVALKVITPVADTPADAVDNFINEARAAALINHPNIVQAYTVNCDSNLWYFAMEYIDGPTVKTLLEEKQRLSAEETLRIASEIIPGLLYANNERHILHRDIKPDNIMMNSAGHAKLADLGLACQASATNPTSDGEITGTPQYIAPELLVGSPADARSDIYSLGATLYHLLTGNPPFDGTSVEEIINKHLATPVTPVLEVCPDAPPPLAALIEGMLAKRPDFRYQTYEDLESDLQLVCKGEMPAFQIHELAQHPIDADSHNPLACPGDEADNPASRTQGKKSLKFTKGQHAASTTGSVEVAADEEAEQTAAKAKPNLAKLGIMIGAAVVVLVAASAFFFLSGSKNEEQAPSTKEATEATAAADATDQAGAPEAAPASDAPTLAHLQSLVQQESDQAFDYAHTLIAQAGDANTVTQAYAALSPLAETRLAVARQQRFTEEDNAWNESVTRLREQRKEKERQEAEAAEQKRQEEERKRQQEERERQEQERKEAIAQAKREKLQKMIEQINNDNYSIALIQFQSPFDNETRELEQWRNSWIELINPANDFYSLIASYNPPAKNNIRIPGYVYYKHKQNAVTENDHYAILPMRLEDIQNDTVILTLNRADVLKAQSRASSILANQINRATQNNPKLKAETTIRFEIPFDILLPEQQLVIAKAAVAAARKKHNIQQRFPDDDAVTAAFAACLIVNGNFLNSVKHADLFQNYRDNAANLEDLVQELQAHTATELADKHAKNLRKLAGLSKQNDPMMRSIIAATITRYLHALGDDFAKEHDDFQKAVADAKNAIK